MLRGILSEVELELVRSVRQVLATAAETLVRCEAPVADRQTLAGASEQLDELFLLVVVGEFNAGKSAVINALLGDRILTEGVTPTTAGIHVIRYGEELSRRPVRGVLEAISAPVELLRQVSIVDTPGTNALEREHEAITEEFVPRSDLVLFVTSADRPFSESERAFLERIRGWGKKVVVLLNKVDLLTTQAEVDEVLAYIRQHGEGLLGTEPDVFGLSAREALAARARGDGAALAASGLPAVEQYLSETLDETERVRLKLVNPLGVAESLLERCSAGLNAALELLADDLATLADIERQLEAYREDVHREFGFRLADIDNVLHELAARGVQFFDDTVRLGRLPELFSRQKLQEQFEEHVVADAPARVEAKVEELIDWLVASDLTQWQAVVEHVQKRRTEHADRIVGQIGGRFSYDRARLLDTVGRAARAGLESYDQAAEARRMAAGVQQAVASTTVLEVGAVSLGATVALVATSTAADVTGLIAAGVMATLGLFVIPAKRARAKRDLRAKIDATREQLMEALQEQFEHEAEESLARIRETYAPYERFVRSERFELEGRRQEAQAVVARLAELREEISGLRPPHAGKSDARVES
jgi:small GTP-binding protein